MPSFVPADIYQYILPPIVGADGSVWQFRITKNATRPCFDVAGRISPNNVFTLDKGQLVILKKTPTRSRVNDQDGDIVGDGFDLELCDFIYFQGMINGVETSTDPSSPNYGGYDTSANKTSLLNLIFAPDDFIWFVHQQNLTTGEIMPPFIIQPNGITARDIPLQAMETSNEQSLGIFSVHCQSYAIMLQMYLMSDIMYATANPGRFAGTILEANYDPTKDWYKINNQMYNSSGTELGLADMANINSPGGTYYFWHGDPFYCGQVEVDGVLVADAGFDALTDEARFYHWIGTGYQSIVTQNAGLPGNPAFKPAPNSSFNSLNGTAEAGQFTLDSDNWPNGAFGMSMRHFLEILAGTAGMYYDLNTYDCEFDFYAPGDNQLDKVTPTPPNLGYNPRKNEYDPIKISFNGLQIPTVTIGTNSATQTVSTTERMQKNDWLYFETAAVWRQVQSITNGTVVVLTSPVSSTTGENVSIGPNIEPVINFNLTFGFLQVAPPPPDHGAGVFATLSVFGNPQSGGFGIAWNGQIAGGAPNHCATAFPSFPGTTEYSGNIVAGGAAVGSAGYYQWSGSITAAQIQTALQAIAPAGVTVTCTGGPLPQSNNYTNTPILIKLTKGGQPYFPNLPMSIVYSTVRDGYYANSTTTIGNTNPTVNIICYPNQYTKWPITWGYDMRLVDVLKLHVFETGCLFYVDVFQFDQTIGGVNYYKGDPILKIKRRRNCQTNIPTKANGGNWVLSTSTLEQTYIAKTHVEISNVGDNSTLCSPSPPFANRNPYQIQIPHRGHPWSGANQRYFDGTPMIFDAVTWDTSLDRAQNWRRFQSASEYDDNIQLTDVDHPDWPGDNALYWCPNPNPDGWMPGAQLYAHVVNQQLFFDTGSGTGADLPLDMNHSSFYFGGGQYVSGTVTGYISLLGCCNRGDTFNPKIHCNTLYATGQYYAQELLQNRIMVRRKYNGCAQIINTTVTSGANSATQTLGSTVGMQAGDTVYFATAGVWRFIQSITSATVVVLTASVSTTTGETVTDKNYRVVRERMIDSFNYRGALRNFKAMDVQVDEIKNTTEVLDMEYFTVAQYLSKLPSVTPLGSNGGGSTGGSAVGAAGGGGGGTGGGATATAPQTGSVVLGPITVGGKTMTGAIITTGDQGPVVITSASRFKHSVANVGAKGMPGIAIVSITTGVGGVATFTIVSDLGDGDNSTVHWEITN